MSSLFSRDVILVLESALEEAKAKNCNIMTTEHILYSLTYFSQTKEILQYLGVDLVELREELDHYFDQYLEKKKGSGEIIKSVGVDALINQAVKQVLSADRSQIQPEDLLCALMSQRDTFGVQLLEEYGVTELAVKEAISLRQQGRLFVQSDTERDARKALPYVATNITELARNGELEPVIGREKEIAQLITILGRKRKSNPLILGDPGVGKTALVYGLCHKLVKKEVPKDLQDYQVYMLDISSLLSGTRFRGDFEERLKAVIEELLEEKKVILFIDEIHSIVGAGATVGDSVDAALILKPYIGSGRLKVIGTTTFDDFKRHLERDKGFLRRFSIIEIDEPSQELVIEILKGISKEFENYHGVKIPLTTIKKSVELSKKYMPDKKLPDKAVEILDHACSIAKYQTSEPVKLVGQKHLAKAISDLTRVPFEDSSKSASSKSNLLKLSVVIKQELFGQDQAVDLVTESVVRRLAGVKINPKKPIGAFLFAGPTGVGKTELAKLLSKYLGARFVRFDMSEFMEKHSISKLVGAPPGYVGHEEGGQLINLVRQHAFNVILFDEIEKAHEDIYMILLQILDAGVLTDSHGRKADFSESIIVLTTNLGSESSRSLGFGTELETSSRLKAIESYFKPEFRNRLDGIIVFNALRETEIKKIAQKFLNELAATVREKGIQLFWSDEVVQYVAEKGFDPKMGARPIARFVEQKIGTELAKKMLQSKGKKFIISLKDAGSSGGGKVIDVSEVIQETVAS
ncbi:MAG: ATP-dependent Clp protease ATP-binding subunit [Deltaproteobacteria bacterium]|nr:ATP-dependent Clp protease ATP-binding subunit [Deltaproteobacteria bacterium]MCX7952401.1 ATP-dependent Clp protease ATP-binding subunit [Deltaproteobacteria bacterium]